MDQTVIPEACARLLAQLVQLWHRKNPHSEPPDPPPSLDIETVELLQELVRVFALQLDSPESTPGALHPQAKAASLVALTRRERDVLCWLAKGKSVSDVSALMQISKCTVRTYIQRSLRKLEVSNRTHAVTRALRFGLIDL